MKSELESIVQWLEGNDETSGPIKLLGEKSA
jgi:hypothetical protein